MNNFVCRLHENNGTVGNGVKFERIGTLDRFNDSKRAEEHDRDKHGHF